jgi:single-strand DNA-binding protein
MSERGINRVVLSGRLVNEPDLRELADGRPVCLLRVACAAARRVPGEQRRRDDEFDVLLVGASARRIGRYLYPGRGVVVQGSLEFECWEAGEGPERELVWVLAERVCFVGAPPRDMRRLDAVLGVSAAVGFSEQMWS